jgi:hypothetical protein
VFEVDLLCREWEVTDKSILGYIDRFMENPPDGGSLDVAKLVYQLRLGPDTKAVEEQLRRGLGLPIPVVVRIVDFGSCDPYVTF